MKDEKEKLDSATSISEDDVDIVARLCEDSILLIEYARSIAAQQLNIIQLVTFYAIGRWIVEVQQNGES